MGQEKVLLGRKGEEIARNYLIKNNYNVLDTNFKFKNGEIDIIAKLDGVLVFFEIKTRKNKNYGDPEFAITRKKHTALYRTAEYYLYKNNIENVDCRIDVITILFDSKGSFKLNHYENI
ncbi:MAG: YraN family protein [Rhodothermaceae bacterium]